MANSPQPRTPRALRVGGVLFLVLGLCLPVLFVILGLRSASEEKSNPQVEGVVVANIEHRDTSRRDRNERNKPTFRPRVDYVVDGETYTYTSSSGSRPPKYDVGEKVMISYDPDRPEVAHIAGSQLTLFLILAACFMVAFGSASIVFFVIASRVRARGDGSTGDGSRGEASWRGSGERPTPSPAEQSGHGARPPGFSGAPNGDMSYPASYPAPMTGPVSRRAASVRRLLPVIAPLVVGVAVAVIAGLLMYNMHSFEQRAVRVEGVVTQLENDQGTFHPVVTYEYKGVERTFRSPSGSKPPAYQKGEKVTLLIDPDLSSEVRIAGEGKVAVRVVLAVGLVLVLLGLALVGVRMIKSRSGQRHSSR